MSFSFFFTWSYSWIFPMKCKEKKFQLAECNIKVKGSLPLHLSKVQIKLNLYREWECTFLPKKCRSEREQNFFSSLAKPWCGKKIFFLARERKSLSLIWNVKINFGHLLRKMSAVPVITNAEADKTMLKIYQFCTFEPTDIFWENVEIEKISVSTKNVKNLKIVLQKWILEIKV